jgi:hypothetical protein
MKVLVLALGASIASPDAELSLANIMLGQSEASVVRALGQPKLRTDRDSDYLPVRLTYPGITVLLDEQVVGGLISNDKRFCTPAGVCPGTPLATAKQIYGPAWITEMVEGSPAGYVHGDGCWLKFSLESGNVQTIELACSP